MKFELFRVSLCAISVIAVTACSAGVQGRSDDGGGPYDTNPGADAAPGPSDGGRGQSPTANAFLVHAALGLGDVRLCFEADALPAFPSDANVPSTNYPGLPVGGAVHFVDAPRFKGRTVTAYAVSAYGLGQLEYGGSPIPCSKIVDPKGVFASGLVAVGSDPLDLSGASVLALVGCAPGAGSAQRCGAGYDPQKGNVRLVEVAEKASLPLASSGALALNLSPSLADALGAGKVTAWLGDLATPCTGSTVPLPSPPAVGAISPAAAAVPDATAYDAHGFSLCAGQASQLARSFAEMQRATSPQAVPSEHFGVRANYVYAMVGDTTAPSGPEALHVLAIPFAASE